MRKQLTAFAACTACALVAGLLPSNHTKAQDGGLRGTLGSLGNQAQQAAEAVIEEVVEKAVGDTSKNSPPDDTTGKTGTTDNGADTALEEESAAEEAAGTTTADNSDGTDEAADSAPAAIVIQNPVRPSERLNTVAPVVSRPPIKVAPEPLVMRNIDLPHFTNNEVLLFLRDDGSNARAIAAANGLSLKTSQRVPLLGLDMVLATLRPGDSVPDALERLRGTQALAWAQPNYIYQLLGNTRTRELGMHGLDQSAALLPEGLPEVRPGAKIVLIDSPVDRSHPSFSGITIKQVEVNASAKPSSHGTAIAEILIGGGEYVGVAKGAQLTSIPAFAPDKDISQHDISTTNLLISAFAIADQVEPDVMNLSFGTLAPVDKALGEAIDAMFAKGVCIAAAAGNGGPGKPVLFPASMNNTIAVAAVDLGENGYTNGSRGPEIDIAALGVDIFAAVPGGRAPVTGTSFATPLVAGAMLRMPACGPANRPEAVRKALALDAKDLGNSGHDPVFGAGLLLFREAALASATLPLDPDTSPPPRPQPSPSPGSPWLAGIAGTALLIGSGFFFMIWRRRREQDKKPS